jgi:transcriptional regulator with XRE-family HTH domain
MTLDPDTLKRRVKSARELAGLDQRDIGALMKTDGLGRHDVGKWERVDPSAPPMSPARAESLARHTGVPPAWFTEPDHTTLFSEPDEGGRVDQLERAVRDLKAEQVGQASALLRIERLLGDQQAPPQPSARRRKVEG